VTPKPTAKPTPRPAAATPKPTPRLTPAPATITVKGTVSAMFANGDFLLAPQGYHVAMSAGTSIVNLGAHIVPSQFIAVGGAVEVTGKLSGSTLSAQKVVVQTHKDF